MTDTQQLPTEMTLTLGDDHLVERSLIIDGMTCASCVRRVERALAKVDGVQEANVNLATERAAVRFDPATADVDALTAAVAKAGYHAEPVAIANGSGAYMRTIITEPTARLTSDLRLRSAISASRASARSSTGSAW